MPLADGATFAGYRILKRLGSGGMGEVYLARHPNLPKLVALKLLTRDMTDDDHVRDRFMDEADHVARLGDHPNIVDVYDRGDRDGQLWIAMQFVKGTDAERLLRESRYRAGMPRQEVFRIMSAVAEALDYAHESDLLHRDVKPSNIFLTEPKSGRRRILLGDFGIARRLTGPNVLTPYNVAIGTFYYAAPEQQMGKTLDGRADQYALAVTAYQLLTGSLPFEHPNLAGLIDLHLHVPPPTLASRRAELADLDPVLATALAKKPSDRFPKCIDFARALTLAPSKTIMPPPQQTRAADEKQERPLDDVFQPLFSGWSENRPKPAAPVAGDRPKSTPAAARSRPTSPPPAAHTSSRTGNASSVGTTRSRRPATAGAIILILLLAAIAFAYRPWQHDRNESTSTPTSVAPAITFEGMRDFVTAYYNDLPARPYDAWKKLNDGGQNQTELSEFVEFWAKIQSVTLISVSPRDATSVAAQLRYVRRDGGAATEDRWLRMVLVNGELKLEESERIGSVDEALLPPPPSTSATPAPDPESSSFQQLRRIASEDRSLVATQAADRWVPQLSSKRPGVVDEGVVWDNVLTMQEHEKLRQRYNAKLLWSGVWSTFDASIYWVTIAPVTFSDANGALRWCTEQGFDSGRCYAKLISTTHGVEGSTAHN